MDRPVDRARRRRVVVAVGLTVLVGLVALSAVFALSARSVYRELSQARDDLVTARTSVAEAEVGAAQDSYAAAADRARSAAATTAGPLWRVAAAVPGIGATPAAVRAVASALDESLSALAPAVRSLESIDPKALAGPDGTVDLEPLQSALAPLAQASEGIHRASDSLDSAPSRADGDWVLPQVDEAVTLLAGQLSEVGRYVDDAISTVTIALPLLGADGPKRFLVAVLNPNEARGTGGFLGTYVILRAKSGRISVEQIGSNAELPTLDRLPRGLGKQYVARYGEDPRSVANMNISPHFPAAAQIWLASWEQKTGEELDGAFAADVVALGDLVTATGQSVRLPDGDRLTGAELTEFAISGIYERFPGPEDSAQRKEFQEQVTAEAFEIVKASPERAALASAIGKALDERRIQVWAADEELQAAILAAGVGGTLAVPDGHHVAFAAINSSGSKLDAFLRTSVVYEVGRCVAPGTADVESEVAVSLISRIPEDAKVPQYMISLAERGPDGPINSALAQFHLPLGAEIVGVQLDGEPVGFVPFLEQDRPSLVLEVDLPPRQERTLVVTFREPDHAGPGMAPAQPLAHELDSTVVDRTC